MREPDKHIFKVVIYFRNYKRKWQQKMGLNFPNLYYMKIVPEADIDSTQNLFCKTIQIVVIIQSPNTHVL